MRRLILIIGLLAVGACAQITFVQAQSGNNGAGPVQLSLTQTSGDSLLVMGGDESQTITPTDTLSDTFTAIASFQGGLTKAQAFLANSIAGGANTITCNETAVNHQRCTVIEMSGGTFSLDKTAHGSATSTNLSTGSVTTTAAAEMIAAFGMGLASSTMSASTPWTIPANGATDGGAIEYQIASSTGTFSGAMTAASSYDWTMLLVTLATGSPGVTMVPRHH